MQETLVQFLGWEDSLERDRLLTPLLLGFPESSVITEYACNRGDLGSIPGLGRFPGEGKGYSLQYSGLENSMDRGACHGVPRVGHDLVTKPPPNLGEIKNCCYM